MKFAWGFLIAFFASNALSDQCSDLQKAVKIGGQLLNLAQVQSQFIQQTYERILQSPEIRVGRLTCSNSAVDLRNGSGANGGLFLIRGDKISTSLLRDYKLDGTLFDATETSPFPWSLDGETSAVLTFHLPTKLIPKRVPALIYKSILYNTGFRLINDVEVGEMFSVRIDSSTEEAIVYWMRSYLWSRGTEIALPIETEPEFDLTGRSQRKTCRILAGP